MSDACAASQDHLLELLEPETSELTELELRAIEDHVQSCVRCSEELSRLRTFVPTLKASLQRSARRAAIEEQIRKGPDELIRRLASRNNLSPAARLLGRLGDLDTSERLELLRQGVEEVLERFPLPRREWLDALWTAGLAAETTRMAAGAKSHAGPIQDTADLIAYALSLHQALGERSPAELLPADDDPVQTALFQVLQTMTLDPP